MPRPVRGHSKRSRWPIERLIHERNIALGSSLSLSSRSTYDHALKSWLDFAKLHDFPVEPNHDTLSYYIAYESCFIEPRSVATYLSGIMNKLEPHFPGIRAVRRHHIVKRTLAGSIRLRSSPVKRKRPMLISELTAIVRTLRPSANHDDLLFVAMLSTGFFALHRIGEITQPDQQSLRDYRRLPRRTTFIFHDDRYEYMLPTSKSDRLFEGNKVVIQRLEDEWDPWASMKRYVTSRDRLFPLQPWLWLDSTGVVPTRSWLLARMRLFLDSSISGHSIRSGGATYLALNRVPDERIQAIGRWSSDAWKVYIRHHPVLLQSLIWNRPTFSLETR